MPFFETGFPFQAGERGFGNHINSRESQPVHEMQARSGDDSFCRMITFDVCRYANMKIDFDGYAIGGVGVG